MFKTRVLVAVIALPILFGLTAVGGMVFAATLLIVLMLGGLEYIDLLRIGGYRPSLPLTLALIMLPLAAAWFDRSDWLEPGLIVLLIAGATYAVWSMEHDHLQPVVELALGVFGGVYIGWLGARLWALRDLPDGALLVVLVYGCVAFADTTAYLVGRQWGAHKLSPHVSPKKTWEGYAGGVVGGLLFGSLLALLIGVDGLTWGHGAILGALIGVLGTVGDLAMSAVKRQVGAKDSSHLIPGHGGILDRLDSALVGAAVGFYYLTWFVF